MVFGKVLNVTILKHNLLLRNQPEREIPRSARNMDPTTSVLEEASRSEALAASGALVDALLTLCLLPEKFLRNRGEFAANPERVGDRPEKRIVPRKEPAVSVRRLVEERLHLIVGIHVSGNTNNMVRALVISILNHTTGRTAGGILYDGSPHAGMKSGEPIILVLEGSEVQFVSHHAPILAGYDPDVKC
jgi:hypothetical protein